MVLGVDDERVEVLLVLFFEVVVDCKWFEEIFSVLLVCYVKCGKVDFFEVV